MFFEPSEGTGKEAGVWSLSNCKHAGSIAGLSFLVGFLVLLVAPTGDSLWIDEVLVGRMLQQVSSIQEWWDYTWNDLDSEKLKPGHTLSALYLSKIFGLDELGLRSANLVWGGLSLAGAALMGRRLGVPFLPLMIAFSPFVFYYMNEFRPYAMQLAGSTVMMAGLLSFFLERQGKEAPSWSVHVFWAGSFIVCSSNMLGVLASGSCVLAAGVIFLVRGWRPSQREAMVSMAWVGLHLCLIVYFILQMYYLPGKAGSVKWSVSPINVGFSLYELLGFGGFGPGREALRSVAVSDGFWGALREIRLALPMILMFGGLYLIAFFNLFSRGTSKFPLTIIVVVVLVPVLNALFLFLGALTAGWPFWGRHLTPAFPFLATATAMGIVAMRKYRLATLVLFLSLSLVGALNVRFSGKEQKDEYRGAANLAREGLQSGLTVWWAANAKGAEYYGLSVIKASDVDSRSTDGGVIYVANVPMDVLVGLPPPRVIILSKPDIYDTFGSIREFIHKNWDSEPEQLPAFVIYRR